MQKTLILILTVAAVTAAVSVATASRNSNTLAVAPTIHTDTKPKELKLTKTRTVERAGGKVRLGYFTSDPVNVPPQTSFFFNATCLRGAKAIDGGFTENTGLIVPDYLGSNSPTSYGYRVVNLNTSLSGPVVFTLTCIK